MSGQSEPFQLTPIGVARTPWSRGNCPRSMRAAREAGRPAEILIHARWRPGLAGLERASHLLLLGWFTNADRQVLLQQPHHLPAPMGCFALRSPARPNPIGVSVVRCLALDVAGGRLAIDALDWFDATPLLDIKPYYPANDSIPNASVTEP